MVFYVYMLFNTVNGKIYIGKATDPKFRLADHLRVVRGGPEKYPKKYHLIHKAISKYGFNNFDFRICQSFDKEDGALLAEKYWISFYKTNVAKYGNEFGYNLADGGLGSSGHKPSAESIAKRIPKVSGSNNWLFGKHISDEAKAKSRASQLGSKSHNFGKRPSAHTRKLISDSLRGRIVSEETRAKISLAQRGELNHAFGKERSEETKKKLAINNRSTSLDEDKVKQIRRLYADGVSQKEIAPLFNIKPNTVSNIVNYKTWKFC
jgi:group I intron endonuclease